MSSNKTTLILEDYSELSIVVRGETKEYKEDLKQLGGKWNGNLKCGPGWIFSKKNKGKVEAYVNGKNKVANVVSPTPKNTPNLSPKTSKTIVPVLQSNAVPSNFVAPNFVRDVKVYFDKLSDTEKITFISGLMNNNTLEDTLMVQIENEIQCPKAKKSAFNSDDEEEVEPVKLLPRPVPKSNPKIQTVYSTISSDDSDSDI
jgi:hypothetical protein